MHNARHVTVNRLSPSMRCQESVRDPKPNMPVPLRGSLGTIKVDFCCCLLSVTPCFFALFNWLYFPTLAHPIPSSIHSSLLPLLRHSFSLNLSVTTVAHQHSPNRQDEDDLDCPFHPAGPGCRSGHHHHYLHHRGSHCHDVCGGPMCQEVSVITPRNFDHIFTPSSPWCSWVNCKLTISTTGNANDVCCIAQCYHVPCPNENQANDTNSCVAACPQGNGSPAETQKYADCEQRCYNSHFLATTYASAAPTGASAGSSNSNSNNNSNNDNNSNSSDGQSNAMTTGSMSSETASSYTGQFSQV